MGHIEIIEDERHLQERLQHHIDSGVPENKLIVVSNRGVEGFLRDYPSVEEEMAGGRDIADIFSRYIAVSDEKASQYTDALNKDELLLYIENDTSAPAAADEETIKLRKERLSVNKDSVNKGEVVVEKYAESEIEEFDVPVNMDNVTVERRPVEGEPLFETYNQTEDGEDDLNVIRIPITKERIRIIKEQVVTEEIIVRKEIIEKTEHVSGTVRREDIRVSEVKNEDLDK